MSTTRPELSKKNQYWINRHRYYELKHFCLQYPVWKQAYTSLTSLSQTPLILEERFKSNELGSPVERCALAREYYLERMECVEQAAKETSDDLANYILKAVTEGLSYSILQVKYRIPCCKDVYYELYRKFFWILNKARN